MKKLLCPHCRSEVSEGAHVCAGCGAELLHGATKRERAHYGCAFAAFALLGGVWVIGAFFHPSPSSETALLVPFGLLASMMLAYFGGKGVARLRHRSQLRFFRAYRHD